MPTPDYEAVVSSAEKACSEAGVKLTRKRQQVLLTLLRSPTPLSAYDLIDCYLATFGETLPAMSMYRILDFLVQEKLAHKLDTTNQYLACAHITCDHAHELPQFLICDSCHSVREIGIGSELINELRAGVERSGFHLHDKQLELHGTCKDCVGVG